MNADRIENRIAECATLFGFEYNGKDGNVDPCYNSKNDRVEYLLFFDGSEQTVYDIKSVMNTPFIAGKTLTEVADKIVITDW